jgi:predicted NBD/HSP70 family sugar kinase
MSSVLTGTNLVYTKQYNLRIVHEVVRRFGPLSRAHIAHRTQLTVQTVSNLVKELTALGLVFETERQKQKQRRGAPSTAVAINPEGAFTIGLDLDRDHLTGVLVDLAGSVRQRQHVDVDFPKPRQALDLMVVTAEALMDAQGLTREEVSGVGVGVPGLMRLAEHGKGYVVSPTSFPGWHDVPLAQWLHERLGIPILLENNATAAAIGERLYGAGQRFRTFFYVYIGSGLGGGLVIDGQPYAGFTGNAGEIGYLPAVLAGDPTATDETPHVGIHFRLPRLYELLRSEGRDVRNPDDLDALLSEGGGGGHAALLAWMDNAADYLTGLVLAVEYVLDPEAIFFGGRLPGRVIAGLMERVALHLPKRRITGKVAGPRHLLATAGVDAAALGVATLPIYEAFAPAPQVLRKKKTAATGSS